VINKEDFLAQSKIFFPDSDFKKLMRKLKNYQNSPQYDDFFVEIVVGLYLRKLGLNAKQDIQIQNFTPDWVIFDDGKKIKGIIEVAHLHIDHQTVQEIKEQEEKNNDNEPFVVSYWMDGNRDNSKRLINKLSKKAKKYKELSKQENVPLFIATFINAKITFYNDEIEDLLYNDKNSFFSLFDFVDGILVIHEVGNYIFDIRYWGDPNRSNKLNLPRNYCLKSR